MKTIALRFGEHFSPDCGTIAAHQMLLDKCGYVWYGKLGAQVSSKIVANICEQEDLKILLINSGKADRYWAHVSEISYEVPPFSEFPEYYHSMAEKMKTWFKIVSFEPAPRNIMEKCFVTSSWSPLSVASKHSMSPYFNITYIEET
jgi:hypothetical protein